MGSASAPYEDISYMRSLRAMAKVPLLSRCIMVLVARRGHVFNTPVSLDDLFFCSLSQTSSQSG